MYLTPTIRARHLSPSNCFNNRLLPSPISNPFSHFSLHFSILSNPLSISAQFANNAERKIEKFTEPLSNFFRRAVGAPQNSQTCDSLAGENAALKENLRNSEEESKNLKERVRNHEDEIRSVNKETHEKGNKLKLSSETVHSNGRKGKGRMSALFSGERKPKAVKVVDPTDFGLEIPNVHKELSSDMQMFAHHLYDRGYFRSAKFISKNEFDATCFRASYARDFFKFAAVNFGKDHQHIADWLSAKDLKKVAIFGCPSLGEKSIKAAKSMRRFFKIDEQQVCQKCVMKDSCVYENKRCDKASTKLYMGHVNRVLTMYAMESIHQKLVVPEEINESVSRLLKEIVSLSQCP